MKEAMQEVGITCNEILPDGAIHRFGKNNNSWYVCYGNAGAYGDWSRDISELWSTRDKQLPPKEQKELSRQVKEAQRIRTEENTKRQEEAAERAREEWENLAVDGKSTYLHQKQVEAYGVRFGTFTRDGTEYSFMVVPLYDVDGKLWSYQRIFDDGTKRFLTGGKKQGCFHLIGTITDGKPFTIAEGYATAASVHMATGSPCAVAFDAGNLEPVIAALRAKYPNSPIIIAADNDQWKERNVGKEKAQEAAVKHGCTVILPEFTNTATKPTDFNDLHVLEGLEAVKLQLQAVKPAPILPIIPEPFRLNKQGVFYVSLNSDKEPLRLCSPLHITAYTHDEDDNSHGRLLQWKSAKNGKLHKWALPCRLFAGDGIEIIARLLDEGLEVTPGRTARNKLLEYIQAVKPAKTAISLSRIGWHGEVFALPDQVFPEGCTMVLQTENRNFDSFRVAGTLAEWQQHVARYTAGNSRLLFALSTGFAAPLLHIASEESGIIHFVGGSSKGKTSTLRLAASIYGGGGENGFIKQWRATGNALEAIAESHRDCLLPLDEMGQADAKTVGDTVYMLANNQGKGRLQSTTALRKTFEWRVLVLSSGEITLDSKMAEAGKKPHAGMQVRCVNIPAEVEGAYGVFEDLHGFASGDSFSRHLKEMCNRYYGTAIRAYLPHVVAMREGIPEVIASIKTEFFQVYVAAEADGQVKRVAGRFALIGAAGELAIDCGILPLTSGDAMNAAGLCFADWLEQRGSIHSSEAEDGIQQIKAFFERYGNSKFTALDEINDSEISEHGNRPIERIGYKQKHGGLYHYYVLSQAYKDELCKGFDPKALTRELIQKGYLIPGNNGKNQLVKKLPGMGSVRVYHFSPTIIAEHEEGN